MKALEVNIGEIKNDCTVIGIDTSGKDAKVKLKCNTCSRELSTYRYKFVDGKFKCNHGRRITNPENYVGEVFGDIKLIEYLGRVDSSHGLRPLFKVKCLNCGREAQEYLYRVQDFDYNCECQKKDYKQLFYTKYSYLIDKTKGTDKIIGLNYKPDADANNRALVKLKCIDCGAEREVSVNTFLNSDSYKKCNCKPKTREIKDPIKRYNQLYLHKRFGKILVDDIIAGNTLQNTLAICKCDCGNTFATMLSNIAAGDTHSCGCLKSFGEHVVIEELTKRNIRFTYQQQMTDLFSASGRRLTFDFMIFDNRNKGVAVIEVDGRHHRQPVYFGSTVSYSKEKLMKQYKSIVRNDKIKDEYVKKHGAYIYRINTDSNMSESEIIAEVDKIISDIIKLGYNIFK